ncbi:hypothetical protein AK830_g2330 [Neonectria ditissima]|uniref:Apple domain-containing protein n=1 Tax=Neonectria ditissima TaxID=78410 RepID=A0A0P7BSA0_9HYPO|nr:hypothetical protein AK830_g2330 [Neonectria ditissima]
MPSLRTIAIAMALSIGAVNAGPCNLSSSASTTSTTESSTITTIATSETVSTATTTAASTTTSTAAGPPICDKSGTLASDSPFDTVTSSSIDVCGATCLGRPACLAVKFTAGAFIGECSLYAASLRSLGFQEGNVNDVTLADRDCEVVP